MEKITVQAQQLRKGDKLKSGGIISGIATQGLSIPTGKVEVSYRAKDGAPRCALWGRTTRIAVERGETS